MYLGTFDSFKFQADAEMSVDTIVKAGEFYGVTKANIVAGEEGLAFMGVPAVVFSLPIETLAEAKEVGTAVYITSAGTLTFDTNDGESTPSDYDRFGTLWKYAAVGATEIQVALK